MPIFPAVAQRSCGCWGVAETAAVEFVLPFCAMRLHGILCKLRTSSDVYAPLLR
jgi:hypothetical protein